jgi:hypothetical protein
MKDDRPSFTSVLVKSVVTHTVTYALIGMIAFALFDYSARYAEPHIAAFMRQTDTPLVMAGPLFQPIRGALFGIVFYLLRDAFFGKKRGWLVMWVMLVVVGILSTFGPSPGSIEGMIYTVWPLTDHLFGAPEVYVQSLLLSLIVTYWVDHPQSRWLSWVMGVLFALMMLFPLLGLLVG